MSWTPESEQKLKKLWKDGLTGSEIAKFFGTTRSAILGKVHRLKLETRATSKRTTNTTKIKTEVTGEVKREKLVGRKKINLYDLRSIYSPDKLLKDKIHYFSIGR